MKAEHDSGGGSSADTRPDGSTPDDAADRVQTAAPDDLDALRKELDEAAGKAEEYLDLLKRTRADFTNYRRRVEEEQAQRARDANLGLVMKLLPVLDDFERALASASPEELQSSWGQGVQLIERSLRAVLAGEDVQKIDAEGAEFSPWEHEAIGRVSSVDVPEGHVVHVVRPGYRRGDRIVRPAQVVVAQPPE